MLIAGSSNGRTSPFEGEYLGPNPSPAARIKLTSFSENFWRRARSAGYSGKGFSRIRRSWRVGLELKILGMRDFLEGRSFDCAAKARSLATFSHSCIGSSQALASLSKLHIFSSKLFLSEKSFERSLR